MLKVRQILVSAVGLFALGVGLAGCGQKGELYLPTEPAAANRATLPSLLRPTFGDARTGGTGVAPSPARSASATSGATTSPVAPVALPEPSPLTAPIIEDSGTLK
ncbi:MAG: LPS translocon maturation chaperone LptM [Janthinobacterium lividum]